MNPRNTWKWFFVVVATLMAIAQLYPPLGRDIVTVFEEKATGQDAVFKQIVEAARKAQGSNDAPTYSNLFAAVGTNDLQKYFPAYSTKTDRDPNRAILNRIQREAAGKIKLGLDLQGGTSFLVGVDVDRSLSDTNAVAGDTNSVAGGTNNGKNNTGEDPIARRKRVLSQAIEVLRKRVDKFGVAEPILQPEGDDRILIQLPGLSEADKESAKRQLQKAAYLEFRLVHPQSDLLISQGLIEPGYEVLKQVIHTADGKEVSRPYLVKKRPEQGLTGKNVRSAIVTRDPVSNQPRIAFELDTPGAEAFATITEENVGHQLAIVLDGELYSAPNITEPIRGGRGEISGSFTTKEAFEVANALENPLEAPVKILEERGVDPSLGRDSIHSGLKAAIIGTIAVAGFMVVYYMLAGLVANVALILNLIILVGVMCSIGTTMTLPGIAGIVLTIGMAVDANVLIYERIREELASGKSMRGALQAGYSKAFGTIFDANLTTLISSVILIYMGTGSVKGFGVSLTIGVTVSMFTALVVTRLIFDWLLSKGLLTDLKMLHIIRGAKIDFMKLAIPAFVASWLLITVGIGYGVIVRGHNVMGVDFAGGDRLTMSYSGDKIGVDKLRETVDKLKVGDSIIAYQKDLATGRETLGVTVAFDKGEVTEKALVQEYPQAKLSRIQLDKVGATVGEEILDTAIKASLLSMFGILLYVAFRYEFSFAVGAVVAIIHDILMTMGWFFLSGRQLSAPMVAAILTIIGFSINDTIVIFDRVREDLKMGVRGTFRQIMNQALNQTLSRTIITSGTVFLSTLSLYLFGGGVINDFAFTFLVGIITGTYSSIYIACAIVLWWNKGERPKLGAEGAPSAGD